MGNYVANGGLGPDTCCSKVSPITSGPNPSLYLGAGFTSAAGSPAGVFLLQLQGGRGQTIPRITDGTSNTMMISEVINNKGDPSDTKYAVGGTEDWRKVLKEATGEDISTRAMMEYFKPLMSWLEEQNKERQIGWD